MPNITPSPPLLPHSHVWRGKVLASLLPTPAATTTHMAMWQQRVGRGNARPSFALDWSVEAGGGEGRC